MIAPAQKDAFKLVGSVSTKGRGGTAPATLVTRFVPRTVGCIRSSSWRPSESWGAQTGVLVHHPPTCQHTGTSPTVRLGTEELKNNPVTLNYYILCYNLLPPIYPLIQCLWYPQEMFLHKERGSITRNFSFTCLLLCTAMNFYLLSYLGLQPSKMSKRNQQYPANLQDQTLVSHV